MAESIAETKEKGLTGSRKAAILMILIGAEKAATIYHHLREEEVERLSMEIASLGTVTAEEKNEVLEEFQALYMGRAYSLQGGPDYANDVLAQVLGKRRADKMMKRVTAVFGDKFFATLRKIEPERLADLLKKEHPQATAIALSYLPTRQSAEVLSLFPRDLQIEVAMRIANTAQIPPETIREVEKALEMKVLRNSGSGVDGVGTLADILVSTSRQEGKLIMDELESRNPELAKEVQDKMFVFDDLQFLEDRSMQMLLRNIDVNVLALALKDTSDQIKELVFNNMTSRNREMIIDEMEVIGNADTRDIESAQQQIVQEVRRMEEEGEGLRMRRK